MWFKNLYLKAVAFVKSFIGKKEDVTPVTLPAETKITADDLDHTIQIVNNVKNAINSPGAIIAVDLIPGTIDDKLRDLLANSLPVLIAGLTFAKEYIGTDQKKVDTLNELLAPVKFSEKPDQNAFYHALAARILMDMSDGKITWSEAVQTLEFYFINLFTKYPAVA